jgi:protein SCO1/2
VGHGGAESIWDLFPKKARVVAAVVLVLALGAVAFATFQPIKVLPRIRLAPGFSFVDQNGVSFTSDTARGKVVLYSFGYGDCGERCSATYRTLSEIVQRAKTEADLGGAELDIVTVSLDPAADLPHLGEVAAASGADGSGWRWVSGDPDLTKTVVGSGFKVFYEPQPDGSVRFDEAFVLVDGWGVVRGEYRYSTLTDDAAKLVRHIGVLGEELRNSNGVASLAYEAAHIFLCYP